MLARFRADPKKVRVSICFDSEDDVWRASVRARAYSFTMKAYDSDPEAAVEVALRSAAAAGIGGIDLEMQWFYEHPWRPS